MPEEFGASVERRHVPDRALRTRRARFLGECARLFPWAAWESMIEPHYHRPRRGRPPYPMPVLLRLVMAQRWLAVSDAALIDAAVDSVALREFVGLGLPWDLAPPDEDTLSKFRRLLERQGLVDEIAKDVDACLTRQGWKLRLGALSEPILSAK